MSLLFFLQRSPFVRTAPHVAPLRTNRANLRQTMYVVNFGRERGEREEERAFCRATFFTAAAAVMAICARIASLSSSDRAHSLHIICRDDLAGRDSLFCQQGTSLSGRTKSGRIFASVLAVDDARRMRNHRLESKGRAICSAIHFPHSASAVLLSNQ